MGRRATWLIAVIAALGLASCADRTPFRPFSSGLGLGPFPPPTPPTPVAPSGPADSLLEANLALWSSSGIDSYRYRFRWECFCGEDYVRVVDITVLNGVIVSVVEASTGRPVSAQAAAYYRSIDGLFDLVREAIDRPVPVRAAYDANLGYPAETLIDYAPQAIDDELGFRIYGLTPLRLQ